MDSQTQMEPQKKEPWTEARKAKLAELWRTKMTRAEIAKFMRTSSGRVRIEARQLGLPKRRTNGQGVR